MELASFKTFSARTVCAPAVVTAAPSRLTCAACVTFFDSPPPLPPAMEALAVSVSRSKVSLFSAVTFTSPATSQLPLTFAVVVPVCESSVSAADTFRAIAPP